MQITSIIAIYLLFWSLTLFTILPLGVKTWHEDKASPVPGQADSAPQDPQLRRKLKLTTVVSAILFGLYYVNYVNGWVTLEDVLPGITPPADVRP